MAASRVFVKGLPPSLTEDDFRTHFTKRYNVTDVKLFAHRRIGYVGFKTPQDASAAVKYFNKTFIRMSRISVELADSDLLRKPSAHPTSRNADAGPNPLPDTQSTGGLPLKRKRDDVPNDKNDRKLKEYLGLMEPPSKLKTWKDNATLDNGDVHRGAEQGHMRTADVQNAVTSSIPRNNAGLIDRTKASSHGSGTSQVETPKVDVKAVVATPSEITATAPVHEAFVVVEDHGSANQNAENAASDMDWMRSRTSRLLGLVEDDEETEQVVANQPNVVAPAQVDEVIDDQTRTDFQGDGAQTPGAGPSLHETTDENADPDLDAFQKSGRLFLRNLPYSVSEADLRELFSAIGPLQDVHLPVDSKSGDPKGFAFVQFEQSDHAVDAFRNLDGRDFQGRLLHILPGAAKRETKLDDFAISKLPLKKQRLIQKKADASSSAFNWNSMYMNADAVLSSISDRLGIPKSELLDPSSSDAAVKQAQAETHVIQETRAYFEANGVDLGAFSSRERGDTAILVKNFSYGTKADELNKLFSEYGDVARVLMPPSGTIAIVEFGQASQARIAFSALAYRKFGDSVLFLEKAPKGLVRGQGKSGQDASAGAAPKPSTSDLMQDDVDTRVVDTSTLFVRNLSFVTTNERFRECFQPLDGFVSARVKTKPDPKHPGNSLSMGFGFLEFRSGAQAEKALAAMNGYNLDGHQLLIKPSHKGHDAAEERKREDQAKRRKERKSKIIIKNLPFEATKKDIQNLFKAYGQLRAVRVPKKFDNSRKGFAFAEFTTPREAENAMDALRDTHLLGRRLVLDFAAGEAEDPEKQIEKMQQKVGRQSNSVALQRLTAPERRKFNIADNDEGHGD